MRLYGSITKVDEEQRLVSGYASTEAKDEAGEIVLKSAVDDALTDYLEFANIREMHRPSAVGTAEEATTDDKGLYLTAKIVDDVAWAKVVSGVYKGFSIGGRVLARDPDNKKIITKIRLIEISLVDRPANPEARFDVWKAAFVEENELMAEAKPNQNEAEIRALAVAELRKALDAQELATAELAAANEAVALAKAAADPVAEVSAAPIEALATEAEATEKTVVVEAAPTEIEAAPDPVAKATGAVDALAAALAPAVDLAKGMYSVGRFAEMLESLSYLVASNEFEAQAEGDGSKVPASLRAWLKDGAAIFKDMAKEEVDELVASSKAQKAAAAEAIAKDAGEAASGIPDVEGGKAVADERTRADGLAKSLGERDDALAKIAERLDPLVKAVEELKASNEALTKRVGIVEDHPAAPKTAGAHAISKGDDAGGSPRGEPRGEEDLVKALAAMTEEDRALSLIKAAHLLPRRLDYR